MLDTASTISFRPTLSTPSFTSSSNGVENPARYATNIPFIHTCTWFRTPSNANTAGPALFRSIDFL